MTGLKAALNHRMDYLTTRQGVVAGNIANASTPNYKAKDLVFQSALKQAQSSPALARTHAGHMGAAASALRSGKLQENTENPTYNGNTVQLDTETLKLSQIQTDYRFMTQLYSKHAQLQRMALGSGAAR